ncbi:Ca-activated chloride channel family protein [Parafrankia irregularis]|uniref:Ca-activated chloride channel family protein n=1 Tax=Parafrankia irregularis TaxID=795642 RepID=A0A0S4QQJ6_9ACTN|nr:MULTISPECIES: substrate-binding and VWA domain-containing protein [Parafrankia]MBE3204326.1 VWA domain-containing protein [Parafrankia sp. CH37]CUU57298.1 Ca-activated chloride channel family protein [Parafrankia irregularis]
MSGARHRYRRTGPSVRRITALAAIPVLAGALTGGWVFLRGSPAVATCAGTVTLTVAVAPSLADPMEELATAYRDEHPAVFGYCASIQVDAVDSGRAAAYLRGGWSDPGAGEIPDVWVPDSADWLALARTTEPANRLLTDTGQLIATSPVVIAMPRPMAVALGWPGHQLSWADLGKQLAEPGDDDYWAAHGKAAWGGFTIGLPDPRTSTSGLSALTVLVAQALDRPAARLIEKDITDDLTDDLTTDSAILRLERAASLLPGSDASLLATLRGTGLDDPGASRLSAIPLSESLVYQYNAGVGLGARLPDGDGPELVASYPSDGLMLDEIRYVQLSRVSSDPVKSRVAADLLALLRSGRGVAALAGHGFRTVDGAADSLGPETGLAARPQELGRKPVTVPTVMTALQATFVGVHQRTNTLMVLDSSGSMAEPVPASGDRSRLAVALDAAKAALPMFADGSNLGLWRFSSRLHGADDWDELVGLGPVEEQVGGADGADEAGGVPRRQAVIDEMSRIEPRGDTGLYETTLAAFRHLNQHYEEGWPNQVVLLTDGRNSDPGSMSLDELVRTLRREYSPLHPVRIITIGYGEDADLEALARISDATGAQSYPALDPNSIFVVLVGAFTEIPG